MTVPLRVETPDGAVVLRDRGTYSVGRDPNCDVPVPGDRVSRRHAALTWDGRAWRLEDLGSQNGTFLDGARVSDVVITERSMVRLGGADRGVTLVVQPLALESAESGTVSFTTANRLVGEIAAVVTVHRTSTLTRIGRASDNDVVLDDLSVSRYHARLERRPDAAVLVDASSHGNTYINGATVGPESVVSDGDLIGIGSFLLRYVGGELQESVDVGAVRFEADQLGVLLAGERRLLDRVSFSLSERSLMAVIGPSGAGKSTLLNALTGFRPANEGSVLYAGRDLYRTYDELRHRIGFVPQDDVLHVQLTPRQTLAYAAKLRLPVDVSESERTDRVDEVLDELGLASRADTPINRLSGGQRKRASVGLELLTKPSLLFLDEPTSGLDPGYERSLTSLLRDLADGGRTIVVVTHSTQSLDLCDRLLVLAPGGAVAYFGPSEDTLGYFDRSAFSEIFTDLEREAEEPWGDRYEQSPEHERFVAGPRLAMEFARDDARASVPKLAPRRGGWFRQVATLTSRYLAVVTRDRRFLYLLALQAPLLGVLMLLALPPNSLQPSENPVRFSSAGIVLSVVFAGATWLGLSNSIREIVKESTVRGRERASGVSNSAYVLSKAAVLGVITVVQAFVLTLIAVAGQGSWQGALLASGPLELGIGAALTGLAAMGLGLWLSAILRTPDRAVALLPVLLLVQLLLSGGFAGITERPGLREASYLSSAQWGFSAGASTSDLQHLQVFNDCLFSVAPSSGISQGEAELAILCVALATEVDDGAATTLELLLIERLGLPAGAVADLVSQVSGILPSERDPAAIEASLGEVLGDPPDAFYVDRIVEIVARTKPLRYWDQTREHWVVNASVLALMAVGSLAGAYIVLRRRDRLTID